MQRPDISLDNFIRNNRGGVIVILLCFCGLVGIGLLNMSLDDSLLHFWKGLDNFQSTKYNNKSTPWFNLTHLTDTTDIGSNESISGN